MGFASTVIVAVRGYISAVKALSRDLGSDERRQRIEIVSSHKSWTVTTGTSTLRGHWMTVTRLLY